ncbi:MAG: Crp/Fnr family transcriptional regulator [Proteobacteria bacterium]|nr:Crp/Fnr family transcriptional regulator [Pseudomonadota bacterium]MBU1736524.1 Crp/Fnr family transcriptional regulator [Pseudomonadota bacterium]
MNRQKMEEFLEIFPSFRQAQAGMVEKIFESAVGHRFDSNSQIYKHGDTCSHIALILAGEIRVYKLSPGGREITLYEIGPGDTCILNASCILSASDYPANAETLSDCEVLLLPAALFRELIAGHEVMRKFVFTMLNQRLVTVMNLVEEVAFGRMAERLADYIVEKSEDDRLSVTHQVIANDLGTSREVISRLLKDLEHRGKISLSRNLITITGSL